jgi:hypothetical protein
MSTGYVLAGRGNGVQFLVGVEIFLISPGFRQALRATKPTILWTLGTLSPDMKRLESEADHSPPSSAEVRNSGVIPAHPDAPLWHAA